MRRLALLALIGLAAALPARAFTPESGFWWAPNEPGSGIALEIQDNFVFLAAYTYDDEGFSTFFTAQGFLDGNARFASQLTAFDDGQCIGCPHIAPIVFPDQGPIEILFDTERTGRLRWGGREIEVERFGFYLKRAEDAAAVPAEVTKMLGEWSLVLDFMNHPDPNFRTYFGDLIIFDLFEFDNGDGLWYYVGCRPEDSEVGLCTQAALENADAAGIYDPQLERHGFVVFDGVDQLGRDICLYYELDVGTNAMRTLLLDDIGGVTVYECGVQNPFLLDFEPVRGFRSASRTFVEGDIGPSSAKEAAGPRISRLTPSMPRTDVDAKTLEEVESMQHRVAIVEKLTERVTRRVR